MPQSMKIATCCYCGTRATLVLDKARHELSCRACGAPLHEMKMMPQPRPTAKPKRERAPTPAMATRPKRKKAKRDDWERPKRRRKGIGRKILEELWDVVEDVFD